MIPNSGLCSALLDRITYRAQISEIGAESCRASPVLTVVKAVQTPHRTVGYDSIVVRYDRLGEAPGCADISQGISLMVAEEHVPTYIQEHGPLEMPVRMLSLANEIAGLKRQPAWAHDKVLGKTLAKEGSLAVVLSVMRAGARAQEHRAAGPVTIHCLEGTVRLQRSGQLVELAAGELMVLDAGVAHSHEALTDCAILLTLSH